jgi:hypothetical protein
MEAFLRIRSTSSRGTRRTPAVRLGGLCESGRRNSNLTHRVVHILEFQQCKFEGYVDYCSSIISFLYYLGDEYQWCGYTLLPMLSMSEILVMITVSPKAA